MNDEPPNPIAAVCHPDPYPYYARLAKRGRISHDPDIGMWVAACAADVEAVLSHPALHVRPDCERVPKAIAGSRAGAVFGKLARMTDGPLHAPRRAIALEQIGTLRGDSFGAAMERCRLDSCSIDDHIDRAAPYALASMLGFEEREYAALFDDARFWIASFAPNPTPSVAASATAAASRLFSQFGARLHSTDETVVSNAMGLLFQSYDATRATIANALLRVMRTPGVKDQLQNGVLSFEQVIDETLHEDPPIQNTRRYAGETVTVREVVIPENAVVLVLLAAANRELAPERSLGFGAGSHACPGSATARWIAAAALRGLLTSGNGLRNPENIAYEPSHNARIPRFSR